METHLQKQVKNNNSQSENQNPNQEQSSSLSPISSSSSSPSHDFSFTISLSSSSKLIRSPNKTTSFAVDLSPADEIFFHGHLLPLHLLSHLPVSPRTSIGAYNDGFTLPNKDLLPEQPTNMESKNNITEKGEDFNSECREKTKPIKSFSLFGLKKWRKGFEINEPEQKKKKLMSLELSHTVKKYIKMLFQRRENGTQFRSKTQTSSYSFSSCSKVNNKRDLMRGRRRRGELFSAPASMRTSPTNSGHLRVSLSSSSAASTSSSSSESTMEELQAAIQAAIAHCKNSSAIDLDDDKVKNS